MSRHPLLLTLAAAALLSARAAAQAPDRYVERIAGTTITLEMVRVPGDSAFWISATEVPWDLYDVYVFGLDREAAAAGADAIARPTRPYVLPGESFGHAGRPAIGMTHHAATQFARWLSARTGRAYRLPTAAEWELACRLGRSEPATTASAWTAANADARTHAPASLEANPLGIHDMLGNVAEWVDGAEGPVAAGGAFDDDPADVTCATRRTQTPAWNATDPQLPKSRWWLPDAPFVGIRLVREDAPAPRPDRH